MTATDAGLCTGTLNVTVTVAPVAVNDTYNGGVDNTQYVITGGTTVTPGTPAVQNGTRLVANDLPNGGVTATAGTFPTGQGGSVVIQTDGTFLYTPPVRPSPLAAITADTFSYTVQSNTGGGAAVTSAAATATINLVGRVWYVLNNGLSGNGQSQSPFLTLAAAQGASTANDHIFIYVGSGTTANLNNGILLKAGQTLAGNGRNLVVNSQLLVPAATNPLIGNGSGNAVTLAEGNTIVGLTVSNPSGIGITGTNINAVTVVPGVTITGSAAGPSSSAAAPGSSTSARRSRTRPTGRFPSRTGRAERGLLGRHHRDRWHRDPAEQQHRRVDLHLQRRDHLNGAGATFTATTSGTLTITGTNTIDETTAPTGPALNVASTTIAAGGLTFQRIPRPEARTASC